MSLKPKFFGFLNYFLAFNNGGCSSNLFFPLYVTTWNISYSRRVFTFHVTYYSGAYKRSSWWRIIRDCIRSEYWRKKRWFGRSEFVNSVNRKCWSNAVCSSIMRAFKDMTRNVNIKIWMNFQSSTFRSLNIQIYKNVKCQECRNINNCCFLEPH